MWIRLLSLHTFRPPENAGIYISAKLWQRFSPWTHGISPFALVRIFCHRGNQNIIYLHGLGERRVRMMNGVWSGFWLGITLCNVTRVNTVDGPRKIQMSKEVCLVSNAFKSLKTNIARPLLVIFCTCSVSLKD